MKHHQSWNLAQSQSKFFYFLSRLAFCLCLSCLLLSNLVNCIAPIFHLSCYIKWTLLFALFFLFVSFINFCVEIRNSLPLIPKILLDILLGLAMPFSCPFPFLFYIHNLKGTYQRFKLGYCHHHVWFNVFPSKVMG